MPKKTKNRSSKQARYEHQARTRAIRREAQLEAAIAATTEAFPTALAAGAFTVITEEGALKVTLDEMRDRINADFAREGEPPLEGLEELTSLLTDEVTEGHVVCLPNGMWRFPDAYLPMTDQA